MREIGKSFFGVCAIAVVYQLGIACELQLTTAKGIGLLGPVETVVAKVSYFKEESGALKEHCCSILYSFTFDRGGNALEGGYERTPIDSGSLTPARKSIPLYDNGRLIGEETYEADGSLFSRTQFIYDAIGNQIKESIYSASGRLMRTMSFTPDQRHLPTEKLIYMFDGTPYGRWTYEEYDSYDNWTQSTLWNWKGGQDKGKWQLDEVYRRLITYFKKAQ